MDGKTETALGLGERLRSARKARALTLEQAAFSLRLEAPVVRALEEERFETLGAAVFVRGHLKAYAKLLGLSEEAVLAAYRAADPNADAPPKVTRELEKPLTTTPGPLAVAAVVVFALLAILVLYLLSGGSEPARPRAVTAPGTGQAPTVELSPTLPPVTVEAPVTTNPETTPSAGLPDPAPAPATPAAEAGVE
ncbi:MAG: helix-turn-helix transcriptional regulator [Gammaproteobacteria bacterium]